MVIIMKDQLVKALAYNSSVRIYAARTTTSVNIASSKHFLWPSASAALGRTMTIGAIMSILNEQHITIRINGGGPIGDIMVDAFSTGNVRGYVSNPHVFFQNNNGHINVKEAVGTNGFIHIIKIIDNKSFTSSSPIQTGEIAEDFAYYFTKSEQIPTAVSLGVLVNDDNSILHSGGFIIQVLPNCREEVISKIEKTLEEIPSISKMLSDNLSIEDIISLLSNNDYKIIGKENINFHCDCSKEKFANSIAVLPLKDINEMIDDGKAETVCHFCNEKYIFNKSELIKIKTSLKK